MINVNRKTTIKPEKETSNSPHQPTNLVAGIVNWQLKLCQNSWRPPTDIIETESAITIRVEIAGMNRSDFSINIHQTKLTISGSRIDPGQNGAFRQMEIHSGNFFTAVELPCQINNHQVNAEYQDGFLTVVLSKTNSDNI